MRERVAVRPGGGLGIAVGERATPNVISWTGRYLRQAILIDGVAGLIAGLIALRSQLHSHGSVPVTYVALSLSLPIAWIACVALARGYGNWGDRFL